MTDFQQAPRHREKDLILFIIAQGNERFVRRIRGLEAGERQLLRPIDRIGILEFRFHEKRPAHDDRDNQRAIAPGLVEQHGQLAVPNVFRRQKGRADEQDASFGRAQGLLNPCVPMRAEFEFFIRPAFDQTLNLERLQLLQQPVEPTFPGIGIHIVFVGVTDEDVGGKHSSHSV